MIVVSQVEREGIYKNKQANKKLMGDIDRAISTLCLDLGGWYVGALL